MERFVGQVDELGEYGFYKKIIEDGEFALEVRIENGTTLTIADNNPSAEQIKAVLCTARMLYQAKDEVSFQQMSEMGQKDQTISTGWRDCFEYVNRNLQLWLQEPADFPIEGDNFTHGQIYKTIVYGKFAHTGKKEEEKVLVWQKNPVAWGLAYQNFNVTLFTIISLALQASNLCKKELNAEHIPPPEEWDGYQPLEPGSIWSTTEPL